MPELEARLTSCQPQPPQPTDPTDPEQAATYVLDLGGAYLDCSATLEEFVAWYRVAKERAREASAAPGG